MKQWLKEYFRHFLKQAPPNLVIGESMKLGISYRKADGSWTPTKVIAEVTKQEL